MPFKKIVILTLVLILFGCSSESDDTSDYTMMLVAADNFGQTSTTYTQGEVIKLDLTITNTGDTDLSFLTGDGCLGSYEIFDSSMSSMGFIPRLCLAVVPRETPLLPGSSLSDSVTWNQDSNLPEVAQLPIGEYTITSTVSGHDNSVSIVITII